jgi:TonB family protein
VKQLILATILSVSLAALAAAQDFPPVVSLNDDRVCHGNITDIKSCVTPPSLTYSPKPKYPKNERKARHEGMVKLRLVVGSDGDPRNIAVSRTLSPDFDESAIEAVKQWKFKPAIKDGRPVPVLINVEVEFHLKS